MNLAPYEPLMQEELLAMWRASFEYGVGITDPHPLDDQRHYFLTTVLPHHRVQLAFDDDKLVGFAAASDDCLAQLYVRVGHHRQGIGGMLLEWAKEQSAGSLWLYTFERNRNAKQFYEANGFEIVARGFEPDWELDDIKYWWSREP